jgi:hypothetical protein
LEKAALHDPSHLQNNAMRLTGGASRVFYENICRAIQ